ncbi:MAG: gas vesicle protein GvpG [Longimonas sp.]|uniref:gas vesicle protein GvpG n=1 Tax=Longimonas sp. TaxID=2039626 RepID=UPI0033626174
MFLIDDILLAPLRGVHFIASSIHDAVREEIESERQALRNELNDLYMALETGDLSEEAFDEREEEVLDRLDELDALQERVQ